MAHATAVTDESVRVRELSDSHGGVKLGEATPSGDVEFQLERYDAKNGKCGIRISLMKVPMKLRIAEGATSPLSGKYITLSESQINAVAEHERKHIRAYMKHLQIVNIEVKKIDDALQAWKGGTADQQRQLADKLVERLTPLLRKYLQTQINLEQKRQYFHLDHLSENVWEITEASIRKHQNATYEDSLELDKLKMAFDFLGQSQSATDAVKEINRRRLETFRELEGILRPILDALGGN